MRVNILKIFALFLFLGITGVAFGQPYTLMNMTNYSWKYNQSGSDLGNAWYATDYNDNVTGWQTGFGVFGIETTAPAGQQIRTPLSFNNAANDRVVTYYFRTSFTLTNDPYTVAVLLTNLIDDGAIYYLNGTELFRQGMAPAPAAVNYKTFSAATVGDAAYVTVTIPYDRLIQGTNYLAVELHDVNATSSDIVHGTALSVQPPPATTALVITNQPASVTSTEGSVVTFSVGVNGFPIPYVQWFKDGVAIPGAKRLQYVINYVDLTNAGSYTVSVSNSLGLVASSAATLTVTPDTNGPVILAANGTASLTNVVVTFNERLLLITATNTSNYRLTNINAGTSLTPISATLAPDGSNVTLVTSARIATNNYLVVVNNVKDASPRQNLIAPGSAFPVRTSIKLLDEYSFFYVYNPVVQFGDAPEPTNIWRNVGFDPFVQDIPRKGAWAKSDLQPGIANYYTAELPGPAGLQLSQNDLLAAAYFAIPFKLDVTPSPLGSSINMECLVDDGAIFWLNNSEFLRINMPDGPVTTNTPALTPVPAPASWKTIFTNLTFRSGSNSLAVQLHSSEQFDLNYCFAVRVSAELSSFANGPIVITRQPANVTVSEGQSATFSFMAAGAAGFQWYSNDVAVVGATSESFTVPFTSLSMNSNRFKVVATNSTSLVTSSNAILNVIADTTGPALVSAYCTSSNTIVATFSEPVTPATAQAVANYSITNRTAPSLTISGAVITNATNVILTVSQGGAGQYILVAKTNILDASPQHNPIGRTNAATVGLQVSFPIVTDWKYNNSGNDLGTAWRAKAYADSTWSNGLALIYNETAALPAAKNTELPINGSASGAYVYTFYFRKHLPLAVGALTANTVMRHIVDDGIVAYINDVEFSRFNMPAGANPAYNSQAGPAIGDAGWTGPTEAPVPGITGGDNVVAVELHQSGTASSDFVFGMELNINAPSVQIIAPPPIIPPRLVINNKATNVLFSLSWTNQPNHTTVLQGTANLAANGSNSVWVNIVNGITVQGNVSTFTTQKGTKAFYRLKVD